MLSAEDHTYILGSQIWQVVWTPSTPPRISHCTGDRIMDLMLSRRRNTSPAILALHEYLPFSKASSEFLIFICYRLLYILYSCLQIRENRSIRVIMEDQILYFKNYLSHPSQLVHLLLAHLRAVQTHSKSSAQARKQKEERASYKVLNKNKRQQLKPPKINNVRII